MQQLPQEINDMIIPRLSKHDLAMASRVCSTWHDFFSPFLWSTIHIKTSETLERFVSAVMEGALIRSGRILDVRFRDAVKLVAKLGQTCTGLIELTVDSQETPRFAGTASAASTSSFSSNPGPPSTSSSFGFGSGAAPGSSAPSGSTFGFGSGAGSGSTVPSGSAFGFESSAAVGSTAPSTGAGLWSSTATTSGFGATTSAFNGVSDTPSIPAAPVGSTPASFGFGASNTSSPSTPFGMTHPPALSVSKTDAFLSHLALILQRNNKLRSLTIKRYIASSASSATTGMSRVLRSLPNSIESLIMIMCPSAFGYRGRALCPDATPLPMPSGPPLTHLRTLQVTAAFTTHTLCELLVRCVALEKLWMGDTQVFPVIMITEVLRSHCPRLNELFLNDRIIADKDVANLLAASTEGWRTLGLGQIRQLGPLSVAKILESAPSLRNLWVDGTTHFSSQNVQTLLSNAPYLTRLCALNERKGAFGDEVCLMAGDLLSSEWACCDSLEILQLEIRQVPRLEHRVRTNGRPFSQEERDRMSKDYPRIKQEMIYERLGQLKTLRELVLGHDEEMDGSNYGLYVVDAQNEGVYANADHIQVGYQYDCLDMSLANGLDRMQGLKELRYVGLMGMSVQFYNADEQAWARKVWPKLGQEVEDTFWKRRWVGFS